MYSTCWLIDDKLDGTNYCLWAYMMRHVLVSKGLWNIVQGIDVRLVVVVNVASAMEIGTVEDVAGSSSIVVPPVIAPPLTVEQTCWDGKDVQAHAIIAMSAKRAITSHIRSCKTTKEAYDALANLYHGKNKARIAYFKKQLDSKIMNEGDSMDGFLTKIKD